MQNWRHKWSGHENIFPLVHTYRFPSCADKWGGVAARIVFPPVLIREERLPESVLMLHFSSCADTWGGEAARIVFPPVLIREEWLPESFSLLC